MQKNKYVFFLQIIDKVITDSEGVLQAVLESYNNLCQSSPINENSADIFLRDIDKISQEDRDLCEGILTYEKCYGALKLMQNNKSPGIDGLSVKSYIRNFLSIW